MTAASVSRATCIDNAKAQLSLYCWSDLKRNGHLRLWQIKCLLPAYIKSMALMYQMHHYWCYVMLKSRAWEYVQSLYILVFCSHRDASGTVRVWNLDTHRTDHVSRWDEMFHATDDSIETCQVYMLQELVPKYGRTSHVGKHSPIHSSQWSKAHTLCSWSVNIEYMLRVPHNTTISKGLSNQHAR